jgi:hypothetical protein
MPRTTDRPALARYAVTGLVLVIGAALATWAALKLGGGPGPVEQALDDVRRLPLIGPVMADNPSVESRMRTTIEEELRNPTLNGPSRPFQLVIELRRQYVVPALRSADDASALAALAARADFARYLRKADPAACRQFAMGALQRPDLLDAEGKRLFEIVLATLEAAWRYGKIANRPQPVLTRDELSASLRAAGFGPDDFERMNSLPKQSNEAVCDIELKLDSVPPLLPEDRRGAFARTILSN